MKWNLGVVTKLNALHQIQDAYSLEIEDSDTSISTKIMILKINLTVISSLHFILCWFIVSFHCFKILSDTLVRNRLFLL